MYGQQKQEKPNTGALFVNDKKQTPNHPDYTGKVNVNGQDFYISGWKKQSKAGKNFLSLSVKAVGEVSRPSQGNGYQNQAQVYGQARQTPGGYAQPAQQFASDDIPF